MKYRTIEPGPNHEAFRADLLAVLSKHAGHLDASEMMALCAYTTGQLVAMQDARKWSPEAAMEIVARNVESGNQQAIAEAHKWMPRA